MNVQRQDSLADQMRDLALIAVREGMYDAAEWIATRFVFESEGVRRGPLVAIGPNSQVARRITEARLSAGFTQQKLADRIGCAVRSVQNWEGGNSIPRHGSVRAVAEATSRPLAFFYELSEAA